SAASTQNTRRTLLSARRRIMSRLAARQVVGEHILEVDVQRVVGPGRQGRHTTEAVAMTLELRLDEALHRAFAFEGLWRGAESDEPERPQRQDRSRDENLGPLPAPHGPIAICHRLE